MFKWKNKTLDGFEQEKIKKNFLPYSILVAALFAMTFFGVCTPNSGPSGPQGPAAYVENEVITFKEFRRAYEIQTERLRGQYGEDFDPAKLNIARNTLQQLVGARIDYLLAQELGVASSEKEVYEFLSNTNLGKDESGEFNPEIFQNWLSRNYYSEATLFEELERSLTVQKLNKLVTDSNFIPSKAVELEYLMAETKMNVEYVVVADSNVKVSVAEGEIDEFLGVESNGKKISDYFEKNSDEFNSPEKVTANHILVAFKGSRNAAGDAAKRSKESAKKLAEKVYNLAKGATDDKFRDLAKQYTDDQSGKNSGGDLGSFTRQMMVKEFSDAAFSMKVGEVSKPVESPFGFHVIKVRDKIEAVNKTLDQSKRDIAREILKKEMAPTAAKELAEKILAQLKAKKSVKGLLKSNGLELDETGLFAISAGFVPKIGANEEIRAKLFKEPGAGKVVEAVVSFGGSHYALKVKEFLRAASDQIQSEKKQQLADRAGFSQGYKFYSALSKSNRDSFDERNAIKYNDSYFKLDSPQN